MSNLYAVVFTEDELNKIKEWCHRNKPYIKEQITVRETIMVAAPIVDGMKWFTIIGEQYNNAKNRAAARENIAGAQEIINTAITKAAEKVNPYPVDIPTGINYFNQNFLWKTSDAKRGHMGFIRIMDMNPKHAANAYEWAINNAAAFYERWVPSGRMSDAYKIAYVTQSMLVKALFKHAKDNGGFTA